MQKLTKLNLGQTKRRKSREKKEHYRAIRFNQSDLSAVAKQCLENNQQRGHSKLMKTVDKSWKSLCKESKCNAY